MASDVRLVVYSDYLCPWCYPAAVRLRRSQELRGPSLVIEHRAFPLRPAPVQPVPFKGTYREAGWQRCGQMSAVDGITFTPWPHATMPNWSLPALEAAKCVARQSDELFERVHPRLYEADFTKSLDISDPRLVADVAAAGRAIRLWIRDGAATRVETVPFSPFLLAADDGPLRDTPGLLSLERLEGAGELRWLARFGAWSAALAARDRCRDATGLPANAPEAAYRFFPDPVHQYLLTTGRTSFGGLRFRDLRRMALDIEVVTTDGYEFPSAAREGDRIVAIALAYSTGFRHVLRGDRMDEAALLVEGGRRGRHRDPDVLDGHNVLRFDLGYIEARARRPGVALAWGPA